MRRAEALSRFPPVVLAVLKQDTHVTLPLAVTFLKRQLRVVALGMKPAAQAETSCVRLQAWRVVVFTAEWCFARPIMIKSDCEAAFRPRSSLFCTLLAMSGLGDHPKIGRAPEREQLRPRP
jgi:hypothetical protein